MKKRKWGGGRKLNFEAKVGKKIEIFTIFFPNENAIRSSIYSIWGGCKVLSRKMPPWFLSTNPPFKL